MRASSIIFSTLQDSSHQHLSMNKLFFHRMRLVGFWSDSLCRQWSSPLCNSSFRSIHASYKEPPKIQHRKLQSAATKYERCEPNSQKEVPKIHIMLPARKTQASESSLKNRVEINRGRPHQLATMFIFDCETTGVKRRHDRVIEIAVQDLAGGDHSTFQSLVNPEGVDIPDNVKAIHGISNEKVKEPGVPRWKDLAPIILKYVESRRQPGLPVLWIAHNARGFDVPFLVNEFKRCGIEVPSDWLFLDTLVLARKIRKPDGSKLPSYSLQSLRDHYNIPLVGNAHRAMSDVRTLTAILQKITYDLRLPVSSLLESSFKAADLNP